MKYSKWIALKTMMFAAIALPTLTFTAYAQQETDPSWYDPWATATKTAVHPARPKATAENRTVRKVSSPGERAKGKKQMRVQAARRTDQRSLVVASK